MFMSKAVPFIDAENARVPEPVLAPTPSETEVRNLDGAMDFFQRTSRQLSNAYLLLEGKVAQLTRELNEVSAQKDEELEKKNRLASRMQAMLDFLPGGVIVLDARGIIVQSNPAARTLLNHRLDGELWRRVISVCFVPSRDDDLDLCTVSGRWVSLATASLDEEGQIILLTDQTETRRLQQQANRHQRLSAMGKMVSALAHQIRTPLSAAILYANHLCADSISEERRKVFAGKLLGRLNHMAEQVKDMLLFVRNELPLNDVISLQDLEAGLRAATEVPLASGKNRCIWQNAVPQEFLRCNREALIGALLNLVNNAIEANPQGVKLKISFCRTALKGESAVAIAVADNGPGMSPEQLSAAQEVFYTTKPQGTGLGLAVVKSVTLAHGGEFRLQSRAGEGTCGILTIPLVESYETAH
ncbi:PAS domain-containing protein [Saccharophagus sp. K07]|nr:PAS domain-containing protein [Saccharophagus sp. K07]